MNTQYYVNYKDLHKKIALHDFEDLLREVELKYDREVFPTSVNYIIYGVEQDIELTLSRIQ